MEFSLLIYEVRTSCCGGPDQIVGVVLIGSLLLHQPEEEVGFTCGLSSSHHKAERSFSPLPFYCCSSPCCKHHGTMWRPSRRIACCFLSVHCLVVRYRYNHHIYFLCLCASVTSSIKHSSLPVKGSRPGKNVQLTEGEIRGLCLKSREIFLSQPILLELEAPLKICGESE